MLLMLGWAEIIFSVFHAPDFGAGGGGVALVNAADPFGAFDILIECPPIGANHDIDKLHFNNGTAEAAGKAGLPAWRVMIVVAVVVHGKPQENMERITKNAYSSR
jgi:hypothetical protein